MARANKETTSKKTAKKTVKAKKAVEKKPAVKAVEKIEKPIKAVKPAKVEEVKTKTPKVSKRVKAQPKGDTGSVDFQINNFSDKIKSLAKHLKTHTHDFDSRRGLLIMVGKRRRLLNYLKKSDTVKYEAAVKTLKLKA